MNHTTIIGGLLFVASLERLSGFKRLGRILRDYFLNVSYPVIASPMPANPVG